MFPGVGDLSRGLDALREAVLAALTLEPALVAAGGHTILLSEAATSGVTVTPSGSSGSSGGYDDSDLAVSSEEDAADRERLIALVELARGGDKDAFGLLFDHYHPSVYRFIYYRTRSQTLAEDLSSGTFFPALRSMSNFRWQGRDFGAWLMTAARTLTPDHLSAPRPRLRSTTPARP